MDLKTKTNLQKTKYLLPASLLIFIAIIMFGGAVLMNVYSYVTVSAMHSPMIFFTLFASSFILFGIGLACSDATNTLIKKYKNRFVRSEKSEPKITVKEKKSNNIINKFEAVKKYITISNAYLLIIVLGAIFAVVSVSLGSTKSLNWNVEKRAYMAENGYYQNPQYFNLEYQPTLSAYEFDKININLNTKNAVVIYFTPANEADNKITVSGYFSYEQQIGATKQSNTLSLIENPSPLLNRAKEKMLFFMFEENVLEKQIKLHIPLSEKDNITISGNYVIAKN